MSELPGEPYNDPNAFEEEKEIRQTQGTIVDLQQLDQARRLQELKPLQLESDSAKIEELLLKGTSTNTPYDAYINLKARATKLTEDGNISQRKILVMYDALFLSHDMGPDLKPYTQRLYARIITQTDVAASGNAHLLDLLKTIKTVFDKSSSNKELMQKPKKQSFLDKLLPQDDKVKQ